MIHGKAFPKGCRLFDHVCIVASLRTIQRRFEKPWITDTVRATLAFDLVVMDCQDLDEGQVVRHSASFW
jgi:hypothetical protein